MIGITFGIIDNGILLIGAVFGLSIERFLPKYFHKGWGAVIGAGIGNAISDFCGGIGERNLSLALGTFVGCIIALLLIPILKYIKSISKYND